MDTWAPSVIPLTDFPVVCSPPIISENNHFLVLGESHKKLDVQILENHKVNFALQFEKVVAVSACLELGHLSFSIQ